MSALTLQHFAESPVTFDRARTYRQPEPRPYAKPRGFWVSVLGEDDWPSWCRDVSYAPHRLAHEHTVTLTEAANILHLGASHRLDAFTSVYGIREQNTHAGYFWTDISIDWARVAVEYDGLIIAPYQRERRLSLDWYGGWDVASGCIWNLDAIEAVEHSASLMMAVPE